MSGQESRERKAGIHPSLNLFSNKPGAHILIFFLLLGAPVSLLVRERRMLVWSWAGLADDFLFVFMAGSFKTKQEGQNFSLFILFFHPHLLIERRQKCGWMKKRRGKRGRNRVQDLDNRSIYLFRDFSLPFWWCCGKVSNERKRQAEPHFLLPDPFNQQPWKGRRDRAVDWVMGLWKKNGRDVSYVQRQARSFLLSFKSYLALDRTSLPWNQARFLSFSFMVLGEPGSITKY